MTRERICAAAEELFLRGGYARTSVRAVAEAAGVAEATVYLGFENKAGLLDQVIIRATRDSPSEPLDSIAAAPADEILPRLATSIAMLMARAGPLIALGESSALMDAALLEKRAQAHRRLRAAFRRIADRLDDEGRLKVSAQNTADTIYGIVTESTYMRMTEGAGMSTNQYADWLASVLAASLLAPPSKVTMKASAET